VHVEDEIDFYNEVGVEEEYNTPPSPKSPIDTMDNVDNEDNLIRQMMKENENLALSYDAFTKTDDFNKVDFLTL